MAQRSKSLGAPSRKSDFGNRKRALLCPERQSKQNALFPEKPKEEKITAKVSSDFHSGNLS
jgi:hypothetical protein